jgi:hypothetical protein
VDHEPDSVQERAVEHLRVIREAMDRASTFTSVPGAALVAMGLSTLAAAALAARAPGDVAWVAVWVTEAVLAAALGLTGVAYKARRQGIRPWRRSVSSFLRAFVPPVAAAVPLTVALAAHGDVTFVPALWLLTYGAGVSAGGVFSVPAVRAMGAAFLCFGTAALVAPPAARDIVLVLGFGGLHAAFGAWIAWRYDG